MTGGRLLWSITTYAEGEIRLSELRPPRMDAFAVALIRAYLVVFALGVLTGWFVFGART